MRWSKDGESASEMEERKVHPGPLLERSLTCPALQGTTRFSIGFFSKFIKRTFKGCVGPQTKSEAPLTVYEENKRIVSDRTRET